MIVVREITNGQWFLLTLFVASFCILYLLDRARQAQWRYLRRDVGVLAAVALALILFGAAIRAGWLWALWMYQNNGWDTGWIEQSYWIVILGNLLGIAGGLCAMRVFARESWGHWVWITAVAAAIVIPIVAHFYV